MLSVFTDFIDIDTEQYPRYVINWEKQIAKQYILLFHYFYIVDTHVYPHGDEKRDWRDNFIMIVCLTFLQWENSNRESLQYFHSY